PLRCPMTVFGGLEDAELTSDELEAWSKHTSGPFEMHVLPGDHFFLNSARPRLLGLLSQALAG
ncbi:MAG TPA: thioesterase domain-containing protein, partial [Chloroflexota bacterium]